jgi:tRNA-Thr(GGU) m(6)t(6)A37 methyltransferase TsaA
MSNFELHPIGRVESSLVDRDEAPKQKEGAPSAWLVFDASVASGLRDLHAGDDVVILTWLDRADREQLVVHPQDDVANPLTGVFSTRSADRPNPIGLHEARVLEVDGARIRVDQLEALDGTPIVDLKPVLAPRRAGEAHATAGAPWADVVRDAPALATFGAGRLAAAPCYLATGLASGAPRVHPVTPVVADDALFVFMEPTSPKGRDLRERGWFALHSGVPDNSGTGGEFTVRGRGVAVDDDDRRAHAKRAASYDVEDRYVLFELLVAEARAKGYGDVPLPDPASWRAADGA